MEVETVRIGIIGAGWVVRNRHLPALKTLPEVELRRIWSRDSAKALGVANEFGIISVSEQWQDVAKSPEVDAVIVATPPVLHCPATLAALNAGKHVLCQGRMARNLSETQQMVEAAKASNRVTALYPPRPGLKGDRVMRRLLQTENFVGKIRDVRVTGITLAGKEGYDWTVDPAVVGVNAMALGMWAEVLNRWVGPATQVAAIGKTHHVRKNTGAEATTEAQVPDSLAVAAHLACGATASYHFSNCAGHGPGSSIEIYGSKGALVYRVFVEEISGASLESDCLRPIPIPTAEERSHTTDGEFIQAIREGTPVSPSFEEGLRYMEFCEAVALSLKNGKSVSVPPAGPKMDSWGLYLGEGAHA